MNTGILLSGYPPEYNLIVKAVVVLAGPAGTVAASVIGSPRDLAEARHDPPASRFSSRSPFHRSDI